jgi:UDP-N-acetylglucosamine 4-epimerase
MVPDAVYTSVMNTPYLSVVSELRDRPRRWLVTGAAGFIGSSLVDALLRLDQTVVGMDNFSTGHFRNLEYVREAVGMKRWQRFHFLKADIRDARACRDAVAGVEYVLHQAALGSVELSIADPLTWNEVNVAGFLNVMFAAKEENVLNIVYASSSAVNGDAPDTLLGDEGGGIPLSPYAVTKSANEQYATVFRLCYGLVPVGLRYYNIYGPRQDPAGAYAAVIPKWIRAMISGEVVKIHGDGQTTRDYCFVDDVVQANLLAALAVPESTGRVYNIGANQQTSLKQLFSKLRAILAEHGVNYPHPPVYGPFRVGDVRHSWADISTSEDLLGYRPEHTLDKGLEATISWFLKNCK